MKEVKLTEKQIKLAIDWWAEKVSRPKFDNGDNSLQGGMAAGMAMLLAKPTNDEQIKIFKIELANLLRTTERARYIGLHVDYHPEQMLADAMEKAGITEENAPWKTNMNFKDDGTVWVSYGYREWIELKEN